MRNKELIEKAVERLRDLDKLKCIILYGSYARGDEDRKSDIDLLIVMGVKKPKLYLKEVIRRIGSIDKDGIISPRLTNMDDYSADFLQNALREGKVLFGALVMNHRKLALKPYRLINYGLSKLPNSVKVRISRRVYGYYSKKGNKKYKYEGLIDDKDVLVYPNSTVLIPESDLGFISFLKRENVPFKEKKVWI